MAEHENHGLELDVIRAVLSDPQSIHVVMAYSDDPSFMRGRKTSILWQAMTELADSDRKIDPPMIEAVVLQNGWATKKQIQQILYEVTSAGESSKNIDDWAEELHRLYRARRQRQVYNTALTKLENGDSEAEVDKWVSDQMAEITSTAQKKSLAEIVQEKRKETKEMQKAGTLKQGLLVGIPPLDQVTHGYGDSYLVIVAGVPKAGKSYFALQQADNVLENTNRSVVIGTFEMPPEQLIERLCAMRSLVDYEKVKTYNLDDEEMARVTKEYDTLEKWASEGRLRILSQEDFPGQVTAKKIYNRVVAEDSRNPVGLLVLDYFQLFYGRDTADHEEASRTVNSIPKGLQIPTILLSQFNRGALKDGRRPTWYDMHGTGQLEKDVDVLVIMDRKDKRIDQTKWDAYNVQKGQVDFYLELHRHGDTTEWSMHMGSKTPVFTMQSSGVSMMPAATPSAPKRRGSPASFEDMMKAA